MDKIYLLIGNDTPLAVCLRKSEGEETPVPYDLSEARHLRLTLVGHGMRVCAKDIEVSGDDDNVVSGMIPGRSLLKGDYDLEVTFTIDGRDKRFAIDNLFEAVDFLAEDADGEAEGEGAGIHVTVTVQPELIEISGPAGPQGKSAYQVWLDDGHTGTEDDFFEWLAAQTPNPDWNQNDSTKADFIKNRTHYEETATASLEWDTDVADTSRKLYLNLGGNRVTLNPYIGLFGLLYWRDVENNWKWQVMVGDTLELWEREDGEDVRYEQYDGFAFATTPQPFNLGFGEGTTVHKLDNKFLDMDTEPTLNSQKPVTSDGVKRAIPTVPAMSTNVEADGTSDSKTSTPKSVKTFVEGKGYYTKPQSGIPASDIAAGVIPTVPTDIVKYTSQSLTDAQKEQARANIGAASDSEVSQLRLDVTDLGGTLQSEIDDITPIVIQGDVTNAPDEEDITTDTNDLLKLKNRVAGINKMGYVILRKNATFAQQVTETNTIYEIRYDFTISGTFAIPAGCVLYFNGGSISGGAVTLNNTYILAGRTKIFSSLSIAGDMSNADVLPEWFGAVADGTSDCTDAMQAALNTGKNVLLGGGEYLCGRTLTMVQSSSLSGGGSESILKCEGIRMNSRTQLHRLTIKANSTTTPYLICVSTQDLTSYYLRISISDIHLVGTYQDANTTTVGILFEICGTDIIKGMFGAYVSNIYQYNNLYRGVVLSSKDTDASNTVPWLTCVSFNNCFWNNTKQTVELVVDQTTQRYNVFSDVQFHAFQAQYNTGYSEQFISLQNCQKFIFDNCFCYDSESVFKSFYLKNKYCRFQVINASGDTPNVIDAQNSAQYETNLVDYTTGLFTTESPTAETILRMRALGSNTFDVGSVAPSRPGIIPSYWGGNRVFRFMNYTGMNATRYDALLGVDGSGYPVCAPNKTGNAAFAVRTIYSDAYIPRTNAANIPNMAEKTYGSMLYNTTALVPMFADKNGGKWLTAYGARITSNVTSIRGTTTDREGMSLSSGNDGLLYYDTTLKKYVLWNGSAWVNVDGTALA